MPPARHFTDSERKERRAQAARLQRAAAGPSQLGCPSSVSPDSVFPSRASQKPTLATATDAPNFRVIERCVQLFIGLHRGL